MTKDNNNKKELDALRESLLIQKKNGYQTEDEATIERAYEFAGGYMEFMDAAKTEREAVTYAVEAAREAGFVEYRPGGELHPGDRIYYNHRDKALILTVIGSESLSEGVRIAAAHIDSPRLDLKPIPLFEASDLAYFKSHYYGGIKKYQWTAIPLALHGRIVRKDGNFVDVKLGEEAGDPKFCVTDLLPHLSREQMKQPLTKAIEGENLNILIGSRSVKGDKAGDLVKLGIMKLLKEKYGITEHDFLSAELELVPAFPASEVGFDRSMIGAYGQDDRVCAYTALEAVLRLEETPKNTVMTVLADKEESGSEGNTGLHSRFMEYFIADLAQSQSLSVRDVLRASVCLSADVNAAYDPSFPSVYEINNSCFLNSGVVVTKYTGSGGKHDTSDASAELMAKVRALLDGKKILWQTGELGKVDAGGGGTVAKYIANLDVDVVDVGVPVLSMHSPFEVVSKLDVYMACRAFEEFFKA